MPAHPLVPVLAGPTASGKTALALELGRRFPLEVVAADAMVVYRGMDVGTAKPTPEERSDVPHHLVDLLEPSEDWSVHAWVEAAEAVIEDIAGRGRVPFVVGGTGFYIRALSEGLPTAPPSRPEAIAALEAELEERGLDAMVAELSAASPTDAARAARNPRRVLRALEVLRATGRPPSAYPVRPPRFPCAKIVLLPDPAELETRIAARTRAMLTGGLLEEARRLEAAFARSGRRPTALQAIGYKQALDHLHGRTSLEETEKRINLATRQYAKRQATWLRAEPGAVVVRTLDDARLALEASIALWLELPQPQGGPGA